MTTEEELPPGWCWSTVGEVGEVRLGRQRSPSNRSDRNPVKYIRAANITWKGLDLSEVLDMDFTPAEQEVFRLRQGDVLLSEASGSAKEVGKPAVWRDEIENCCFQNTVIRFRSKCVEPSYALLAFNHLARNGLFAKVSKGVGIQHLSADRFAQLRFPLPPAMEQLRIVEKAEETLSDLDAGVKLLERARANLKKYRAAVLKAAVTGELTADWRAAHPDVEPASQLLDRILTERRQKWEADQQAKFTANGKTSPKGWREKYTETTVPDTTKLPSLPDRWCWAMVEQLGFIDVGFAFKSAEFETTGIRLLRGENIEPGALRWKDVVHWPEEKLSGFEHFLIEEGEIILAMDRPIISSGLKIARAKAEDLPCLLVQRMARFRLVEPGVTPFLHYSAQTHEFIAHLLGGQTGTQLPHISGSGIASYCTPLPPLDEQEVIAAEVERQLSDLAATEAYVEASLKRAGRLRQSILKEAFAGRLVPQDPADEPASALLDRIRQARAANDSAAVTRTRRSRRAAPLSAEAADGRT
jgi:type I restriction enzyme S subunit